LKKQAAGERRQPVWEKAGGKHRRCTACALRSAQANGKQALCRKKVMSGRGIRPPIMAIKWQQNIVEIEEIT
jgi:hypothetical protein